MSTLVRIGREVTADTYQRLAEDYDRRGRRTDADRCRGVVQRCALL